MCVCARVHVGVSSFHHPPNSHYCRSKPIQRKATCYAVSPCFSCCGRGYRCRFLSRHMHVAVAVDDDGGDDVPVVAVAAVVIDDDDDEMCLLLLLLVLA